MSNKPTERPARLSDAEIERLCELERQALAGHWYSDLDPRIDGAHQVCRQVEGDKIKSLTVCFMATGVDDDESVPTTDLIAAARNALPALLTELVELRKLVKGVNDAIDAEPELPGDMPDEMWEKIRIDRELARMAFILTVKATKQGIINRIAALAAPHGVEVE